MPWGQMGVSKKQYISNGTQSWGVGGVPSIIQLQQVGILNKLRLIQTGTGVATLGGGTLAKDTMGPYNIFNQLALTSNQQAPIFQVSGYGMYLINTIIFGLEYGGNTPDTTVVSEQNVTDPSYAFNFATVVPSAPNNVLDPTFFLDLPIAQKVRSLGGDIGMFILQNPNVQLQFSYTPNSASTASPFNIFSTSKNVAPFVSTGAATFTYAGPSVDLVRVLYEAVTNPADYPNTEWVSQWLEEFPQGGVGGLSSIFWKKTPVAGLLARIAMWVNDSNFAATGGVNTSNLTASNAINLTYETNITKFSETGFEAIARQREVFVHDLPQGMFCYDLLGPDLTIQDCLDTGRVPNIQMQMNFAAALGSTSTAKVLYQTLLPVGYR